MILSKQKCSVHANNNYNTSPATPKKRSFLSMIRNRLAGRAHARHLVLEVPEFDPASFRKVITYLQTGDIKVEITDVIGECGRSINKGKTKIEPLLAFLGYQETIAKFIYLLECRFTLCLRIFHVCYGSQHWGVRKPDRDQGKPTTVRT